MYRYKIRGEGFEFDYAEESRMRLREGSIVKPGEGPDQFEVTRITKEPRAVFGFSAPLLSSRGEAEAKPFPSS